MEVLYEYQQRYSQTERGSCHIWAFEYFHSYIFGVPFTVYTDHKPLVVMLNNPRSQLSARFERWFMRAKPYGITVQYRSGADNSADHLSPSCQTVYRRRERKIAEKYIHYVVTSLTAKATAVEEVTAETVKEATLMAVITVVITNE